LKSQLDEYMAQNKLSWDKVNTTLAVLNTGLSDSGLGQEDVKKVSGDIVHAGSLVDYIKKRESEKAKLETKLNQLSAKCQELEASNTALGMTKSELTTSVQAKTEAEKEIFDILQAEMNKLAKVEHIISCHIDSIGITRLLLNFLTTSNEISDFDIEHLTHMIIFISVARLGITPDKYKHVNGGYIYECKIPQSYFATSLDYTYSIDTARKKLATILAPLVQNEFMPKFEWNLKQLQEIAKKCTDMQAELMNLQIKQQ
jgi:hypothetical protein